MRQTLRQTIPSMFHRRLLMLGLAAVMLMGLLGLKTAQLTTGESFAQARAESESKLQTTRYIATKRGSITDRYGRVLAEDDPGWEAAVHFDVITGQWAAKQARRDARADRARWDALDDHGRDALETKLRQDYERQIEEMFQTLAEVTGAGHDRVRLRRDRIITGVAELQTYLWRQWQETEERKRGEPVLLEEVARPIAEQNERHVIVRDLTDRQRLLIEGFIAEGVQQGGGGAASGDRGNAQRVWGQVELRRVTVRRYPMETVRVKLDRTTLPGPLANEEPIELVVRGLGTHIVGLMRESWREDVMAKPFRREGREPDLRGYRAGDPLGRSGIEQSMEATLRGARGIRRVNVDTGLVEEETAPLAGDGVTLSIDILLQAHIQAVMDPDFGLMRTLPWHLGPDDDPELVGNPLNGSAVVVDIASGDILAAVSMPSAPRALLAEDPQLLWDDPINLPMTNRAFAVSYQSGSTLKPLVLMAAVTDGVLREGELVYCAGHLWPDNPFAYRDWIYKLTGVPFGEIDGETAIARSSNVFLGILAQRLMDRVEFNRLVWWYEQFGLGQVHDIGLAEEIGGDLGPRDGRELRRSDIEFMAIGQGPVNWTPFQAATAYARLVNRDLTQEPRLILSPERERDLPPREPADVTPSPVGLRMALEGMRRGANTHNGTTHHISHEPSGMNRVPIFNVEGVTVMAKSGTADPGRVRWIDLDLDNVQDEGELVQDPRDHAWVVALVQPEGAAKPTHAVVVVVEYAGSGGRVAGPVANQIVHALQHHQYLQWPPVR